MPRLFVLDAMGLAYRAYYAFIRRPLLNSRGENTSALFGFANTALKIRREEQPDFWALAWDGPGPTERHLRYPDYKAHRKPMPGDLLTQIPAIEDLAQALGLPVLEIPGLEADDVMATLARRGADAGFDVALVTSDKDLLPLVGPRVRLLSPAVRGEAYVWVDAERVQAEWGVAPGQIRDVLALMGDSSDNVPGVPGVGGKTAVELIGRFGSFDALYERLGEVTRETLRRNLEQHRDEALLSRELVTVRTDCPLEVTWNDLKLAPIRRDALVALARRYELVRLEQIAQELGVPDEDAGPTVPARAPGRRGTAAEMEGAGVRLTPRDAASAATRASEPAAPASDAAPAREPRSASAAAAKTRVPAAPPPDAYRAAPPTPPPAPADARPFARPAAVQASLDLFEPSSGEDAAERLARLHAVRARALHGLALLPIAAGEPGRHATLAGLALAARDGTTAYAPLAHAAGPNLSAAEAREWLAPMLADPATPKVGWDLKRDHHALSGAGLPIDGLALDVHVASFLCDPERDHSLEALARDVLGLMLPAFADAAAPRPARARNRPEALSPAEVSRVAEARVATLFPLGAALRAQLESREQWPLYERIEHPLIAVLAAMEETGILLDRAVLSALAERAAAEIARLETELYALAGGPLNLNSGPQLSKLLFETLGLKTGRRTKTGFSTDQAVLEELAASHPFPARLLEYRALAKLKSTYFDALPGELDPRDGRVHTTFEQTGAATGRLSSSRPNLQNIPMRSPQGREIRRAFVAPPGSLLVGADYSQIELRVMAHLSGDPGLVEAFERGEDVHASTARKIFGVTQGDIDPTLRARAKVVNFGVMYGMGARSLSQQMGIGLTEAQDFIGHYFRVFARVREFLDRSVEEARERGYAATLFGRRRYLPDLASPSGGARAMAERVAVNMPIQGSAADLMKLAMVRVHDALKGSVPSARLLLQVHDELLLEVPRADADAAAQIMRAEMERCFRLRVPLEVSVGLGDTWFDVH